MDNDMRNGEVRLDHWLLHGKVYDLPTIVESLKTIDRKSVYKTADICQIMICKDEIDPSSTEEESPAKNKKKDSFKVDKKFLWPHGITPPTKNVRKRRFRKTLKKKCVEAPEIEKEVKRLLRADNEAVSFTWEVIQEEDDHSSKPETVNITKTEKAKTKKGHNVKAEIANQSSSKVEDIFGGALSDSDLEDENINVDVEDSRMSSYDDQYSEASVQGSDRFATQFNSDMFYYSQMLNPERADNDTAEKRKVVAHKSGLQYSVDDYLKAPSETGVKMQQLATELEELKQRRQRTQLEIAGMENMTLRQRFQEILLTINKEIIYKEMEYQKLLKQ